MKKEISTTELEKRIELNYNRLTEPYYQIENVFNGDGSQWPGDKEGRALLAFVCHYKMSGKKVPCMEQMMDAIPEVTNGKCYWGQPTGDVLFEQQLSGTSWYLRGLCEYYEQFGDERAMDYLKKTVDGIYIPTRGRIASYPIDRDENNDGGVGGHSSGVIGEWKLSTDIGCAFMSLDGLSHYYKLTKDQRVKELFDEMADFFDKIDKLTLQTQTHCTLTAGRGLMRMYDVVGDRAYFEKAERIFKLYVEHGMTYTYQNFNWFGKGDTWTEPCAVVDSLMLALQLYDVTNDESYRTYAARIYHNGFATFQRPNGGAGTDTTVSDTTSELKVGAVYEAHFCCTMRLAEGLLCVMENRDRLYAETVGKVTKDSVGRYSDGDIVYAEISDNLKLFAEEAVSVDGLELYPIVKLYKLKDKETCQSAVQKIIFK